MKNTNAISAALYDSRRLLSWFIEKTNFKVWQLLWLPSPRLGWGRTAEVFLRSSQLIFSIPAFLTDVFIMLIAVLLYFASTALIFIFFLIYGILKKIFNAVIQSGLKPLLKLLSWAAALFIIYFLITEKWTDISGILLEYWELLLS